MTSKIFGSDYKTQKFAVNSMARIACIIALKVQLQHETRSIIIKRINLLVFFLLASRSFNFQILLLRSLIDVSPFIAKLQTHPEFQFLPTYNVCNGSCRNNKTLPLIHLQESIFPATSNLKRTYLYKGLTAQNLEHDAQIRSIRQIGKKKLPSEEGIN